MRPIDADALDDVIQILNEKKWDITRNNYKLIDAVLSEFPTIEERKTGKWIEVRIMPKAFDITGDETWASVMQCDKCGFEMFAVEGHMAQYNFCPSCGADLKGEQE